ncbi:hypothetical protein EMPS_08248 [Entomortierella parvispora]|uniref:Uncharacterized protein n=1 Tax=Entomortierella parvispora TaxID=205924 RepID=A0A9P3HG17_9FUNG|nr:hypothetical protein EMPS_08248 [Entomortierella parvispora]
MSDHNSSISNVDNSSSIASNDLNLVPALQTDRPRFRIGGFQGTLPTGNILPPAPSSPSVPNTTPAVGDVDVVEENKEKRSDEEEAELDAQEAEDAKIRAQRRKQLQELADSGELDFMNNVRPGKVYTLPVVKPKLL